MKTSAGVAIVWKDKVLVVHPTRASRFNTYAPPKGGIEPGEEIIDAAIRETREEIGISVKKENLLPSFDVLYTNPKGVTYKTVTLFPLVIKKLSEIDLKSETVPLSQLQLEEVDDARFMSIDELQKRAMPRYFDHLKKLVEKHAR